MAITYRLKTFSDILEAVRGELKVQLGDSATINRIKRDINTIYKNEVCPIHAWKWLRKNITLNSVPAFFLGTSNVVSNSQAVTLTQSPATSKKGFFFTTIDFTEIYLIKEHDAGSNILVLDRPYMGITNTLARYNIWTDAVSLPPDVRETVEVWTDFNSEPLSAIGYQEFRRQALLNPKSQDRPLFYSTSDFVDPDPWSSVSGLPATASRKSSGKIRSIRFAATLGSTTLLVNPGDKILLEDASNVNYNGEYIVKAVVTTNTTNDTIQLVSDKAFTEAFTADTGITVSKRNVEDAFERYRNLLIYPSNIPTKTTLHIEAIIHPQDLSEDSDEPLIPIEDRNILVYGALHLGWARERNPEESARNFQLFQGKLGQMKSNIDDSTDYPQLTVSRSYLRIRRASRSGRIRGWRG